jgi:hypothetical protein
MIVRDEADVILEWEETKLYAEIVFWLSIAFIIAAELVMSIMRGV